MSSHQRTLTFLILLSGMAALSWEVIWQLKASLALGVSAWGTALTLAITMGGMSVGALLCGWLLRARKHGRPLYIYAALEIMIGICGLLLIPGFSLIEAIDTRIHNSQTTNGIIVHLIGITILLGVPAMGMGATMPVIGLMARQAKMPVASLYGINTLGAAAGTLAVALLLIPMIGVHAATLGVTFINIAIAFAAIVTENALSKNGAQTQGPLAAETKATHHTRTLTPRAELCVSALTGFCTFVLEVAWFRALSSAYSSTSVAFAVMLSVALLALGLGARMAPWLKANGFKIGHILALSGIVTLAFTPGLERIDLIVMPETNISLFWVMNKYMLTIAAIGLPMLLIGISLPWILDDQNSPQRWGLLYGLNAAAAITGALVAGWMMLPLIGFVQTIWIAGILLAVCGLIISPHHKKALAFAATAALVLTVSLQSGIGTSRIIGWEIPKQKPTALLQTLEGPDATVSAVEYESGLRALIINGFGATAQSKDGEYGPEHYMIWMGHLPMLMHPAPATALVICFGTGQTANALRQENPTQLDIVDINKNVFQLAPHFTANDKVLEDPRVNAITMDGRAYIRRTSKLYDVITLEPMPPTFAGVNALYSHEFYKTAHSKMTDNGTIAQWLPFHLVTTEQSRSVARTFVDVFPGAILWLDPISRTGILLGSKNPEADLTDQWPGFARTKMDRTLTEKEVRDAIILNQEDLLTYAESGTIITDNNQHLAYSHITLSQTNGKQRNDDNLAIIDAIAERTP